ncbi:MAG: lytic transglycosylase domain-containing protein [Granulosicoccus sp.]
MDNNTNTLVSRTRLALTVIGCVGMLCLSQPSAADAKSYKHRAADGTVTFSDTPIVNGVIHRRSYGSAKRAMAVSNPCSGLSAAQLDERGRELDSIISIAAKKFALDAALIKAVARAESCFDPLAVSRVGAKGLMQLMPPTARELGVSNIFDIRENVMGGARYLAEMLDRYSNNTNLALAAYNAGPGNVDRYDGVPPFAETTRYIEQVKGHRIRYLQAPDASALTAQSAY